MTLLESLFGCTHPLTEAIRLTQPDRLLMHGLSGWNEFALVASVADELVAAGRPLTDDERRVVQVADKHRLYSPPRQQGRPIPAEMAQRITEAEAELERRRTAADAALEALVSARRHGLKYPERCLAALKKSPRQPERAVPRSSSGPGLPRSIPRWLRSLANVRSWNAFVNPGVSMGFRGRVRHPFSA